MVSGDLHGFFGDLLKHHWIYSLKKWWFNTDLMTSFLFHSKHWRKSGVQLNWIMPFGFCCGLFWDVTIKHGIFMRLTKMELNHEKSGKWMGKIHLGLRKNRRLRYPFHRPIPSLDLTDVLWCIYHSYNAKYQIVGCITNHNGDIMPKENYWDIRALYIYIYVRTYVRMYVCTYVRMYVCTYVRMYVCTCVRMYVCTYVRMYVCTYVRMYVCTYVRMYVCTYVRMYVCTYVRMYVCTYVRMYVCTNVRMYVCMYVCMYVRTYVRTYVRMHASIYVSIYLCIYVSMYLCIYVSMYVHMYVRTYVCMYAWLYIVIYVISQTPVGKSGNFKAPRGDTVGDTPTLDDGFFPKTFRSKWRSSILPSGYVKIAIKNGQL